MSRDANGNYTLPSGNPVVSGTTIESGWANPTMEDLAAEMTDSLSRSGKGGMSVAFQNVDGAVSAPGITWTLEPATGFYRAGSNDMRATVQGVDKMRWDGTDVATWDGSTWNTVQTTKSADARYAPLTHFAPNGDAAQLLHGGNARFSTTADGVQVDDTLEARLALIGGTGEVRLSSGSGGAAVLSSRVDGQSLTLQVRNAAAQRNVLLAEAGGAVSTYFDDKLRTYTESQGLSVRSDAAENVRIRAYMDDVEQTRLEADTLGNVNLSGRIDGARLRLLVNNGGVFDIGLESLPGGRTGIYEAGLLKVSTAPGGGITTGQHAVTDAVPTADQHLTRKDYVDGKDEAIKTGAEAYASAGDAATLASANAYTDGAVATTNKIVSGELSTLVAGQNAISFGITFSSPPQVIITAIMAAGLGGAYNFGVNTRTNTGCNIYSSLATAGNLDGMMWVAIGPV